MEIRKIAQHKPRVALLLDTWFPVHTGEQVYASRLARALVEEGGYHVDVFTRAIGGHLSPEERSVETLPGVKVRRLGWKSHPWNLIMHAWYMGRVFFSLLFAGQRYSIYHANSATTAIPMKMASWFTRVPTILTVHANHVLDRTWTLRKVVHRVMFLETRYTQEISISEQFLKAQNINDPVLVIPYGVDTDPFDALQETKHPEQFHALYVGRLDLAKGLDVLLKAVQKIVDSTGFIRSQRDFQLHLVGQGPDRAFLEGLTAQLGLEKYVRFHGLLGGEALIRRYLASDLFVLPSRAEALPFSVLEACAARLPILATQVGDLRNLVLENRNGHLVEPGDVEELAYYLEQFVGNPHLARLGEASYELVRQEYTWDSTVEKTLRVYDSLRQKQEHPSVSTSSEFISPLALPVALLRARAARRPYRGRKALRFCLTVNLNPMTLDTLPHEDAVLVPFLERFTEFCAQWSIPSTVFFQTELLEPFHEEILALQEGGHEVGLRLGSNDWSSLPVRKKALRTARETLNRLDIKARMVHLPADPKQEDLELLHSNGFEFLPVSEDPDPLIEWRKSLPVGRIVRMNIGTFLKDVPEAFLQRIHRLCAYQKHHGMDPFLIFEWDLEEEAGGEAFTELAKKFSFLKEHMDLEFMTLDQFCKSY